MKRLVRGLAVVVCLLGSASVSQASNIIINGSFEDPACTVATPCDPGFNWGLFDSITGWTAVSGTKIEIGNGSLYGITGYDGEQVMELDSNGNSVVAQFVAGPGDFVLSFLYADRNYQPFEPTTDGFAVFWNNVLLPLVMPLANPPNSAMQLYSLNVTAQAGFNTLAFVGLGPSDSIGVLIDDVRLEAVPDGGLTALLLGVSMVGLARIRRMIP